MGKRSYSANLNGFFRDKWNYFSLLTSLFLGFFSSETADPDALL